MAEVLLGKGDYADAIKHFRTDRSATMPYLAAVHERMRDKNPMQAMKFATQIQFLSEDKVSYGSLDRGLAEFLRRKAACPGK